MKLEGREDEMLCAILKALIFFGVSFGPSLVVDFEVGYSV